MGVIQVLPPIYTPETMWQTSFPVPQGPFTHLNVDEGMDNIDESDYNGEIRNNSLIRYRLGKLSDEGLVNHIKMAFNVKRFVTQGTAALRLDVYLAGSKVVPTTEISVHGIINYEARQVLWLANVFLAPWVGLTGQQWNDEIDLDIDAAQFWLETFSASGPPLPDPDPYVL